jgi:formate hydrogenlyase subunit 6/NADH:ubiquinone oxidoreductase subunit I
VSGPDCIGCKFCGMTCPDSAIEVAVLDEAEVAGGK